MSQARLLRNRFPDLRVMVLLALPFLAEEQACAGEALAGVVADGKPWEMYVVKRRASNLLVFRPDGRGTVSDSLESINPTWRAVPGGICITPRPGDSERCLQLKRTNAGIAASQNGKTIWVLKR